jgi:hypothetical protein
MGAPPRRFGKAACLGGGEACPYFALVAGAEVPSPELDVALPQGKGAGGTTAADPLRGEGGTAGSRDAGGACALLLT